jgi:hypothetical protein
MALVNRRVTAVGPALAAGSEESGKEESAMMGRVVHGSLGP